eukprot:117735-Amphidinium_carterae.1
MAGDSELEEEEDAREILVAFADARSKVHQKRMGRGFFKSSNHAGSSSAMSTIAHVLVPCHRSNSSTSCREWTAQAKYLCSASSLENSDACMRVAQGQNSQTSSQSVPEVLA